MSILRASVTTKYTFYSLSLLLKSPMATFQRGVKFLCGTPCLTPLLNINSYDLSSNLLRIHAFRCQALRLLKHQIEQRVTSVPYPLLRRLPVFSVCPVVLPPNPTFWVFPALEHVAFCFLSYPSFNVFIICKCYDLPTPILWVGIDSRYKFSKFCCIFNPNIY